MKKLMSLDKQVEARAEKWLIRNNQQMDKEQIKSYFEDNKKEIIKQYLIANPKIAKEYQEKRKVLRRVGMAIATTGVVAVTLAGTYIVGKDSKTDDLSDKVVRMEEEYIQENEEEIQENNYEEFFEEARNIKSTEKRDEYITENTKKIIVEYYNKQNPENPITEDMLETLILNENVLQKTDRLGNVTYERVAQNIMYEQTENQKLVKIGNIYDFRINGKSVAVFDSNENILPDKNVEKTDMIFKDTLDTVKEMENLKEIYINEKNTDYYIEKQEEKYKNTANQLLEKAKNENVKMATQEIEKD